MLTLSPDLTAALADPTATLGTFLRLGVIGDGWSEYLNVSDIGEPVTLGGVSYTAGSLLAVRAPQSVLVVGGAHTVDFQVGDPGGVYASKLRSAGAPNCTIQIVAYFLRAGTWVGPLALFSGYVAEYEFGWTEDRGAVLTVRGVAQIRKTDADNSFLLSHAAQQQRDSTDTSLSQVGQVANETILWEAAADSQGNPLDPDQL